MFRKLMLLISAALVLALAGTAAAAPSARDPRVPTLQRQVRSLQTQVTELQNVVNNNATVLNRAVDLADCRFVYQFRFNVAVLDIFAAMFGAAPYSGGFPSDNGACARVGISPPTRLLAGRSPLTALKYLLVAVGR